MTKMDRLAGLQESYSRDLKFHFKDHILTIIIDCPKRLNAFSPQVYQGMIDGLQYASESDEVHVVVLTGSKQSSHFSSGNDLSNFKHAIAKTRGDVNKAMDFMKEKCQEFVESLIQFDKAIIASVNGSAVGIGVTMLGLCDFVYAVHEATFKTPFLDLALTPEGGSSLMFPLMMGMHRANEMLLLGREITADKAKEWGLVNECLSREELDTHVRKVAVRLANYPPQALRISKRLIRQAPGSAFTALSQQNEVECTELCERWKSTEAMAKVQQFMARRSKL